MSKKYKPWPEEGAGLKPGIYLVPGGNIELIVTTARPDLCCGEYKALNDEGKAILMWAFTEDPPGTDSPMCAEFKRVAAGFLKDA